MFVCSPSMIPVNPACRIFFASWGPSRPGIQNVIITISYLEKETPNFCAMTEFSIIENATSLQFAWTTLCDFFVRIKLSTLFAIAESSTRRKRRDFIFNLCTYFKHEQRLYGLEGKWYASAHVSMKTIAWKAFAISCLFLSSSGETIGIGAGLWWWCCDGRLSILTSVVT